MLSPNTENQSRTLALKHSTGSLRQNNKVKKENKRQRDWKELKPPLLIDDMIVYVDNPTNKTKNS